MSASCRTIFPRLHRSLGHRSSGVRRVAFTMPEVCLVLVIVGVGALAMMELIATGTRANAQNYQQTNGLHLANNVREHMRQATFTDTLAMQGTEYSPPIDARGREIQIMSGWSQRINVQRIDIDRLTHDVPSTADVSAVRVTVDVRRPNVDEPLYSASWLAFDVP